MSVLAGARPDSCRASAREQHRSSCPCMYCMSQGSFTWYTAAGEIHTMRNARCVRSRSETAFGFCISVNPLPFCGTLRRGLFTALGPLDTRFLHPLRDLAMAHHTQTKG